MIDEDRHRQPAIDDVPLKLTEERFLAESQRNRRPVNPVEAVTLEPLTATEHEQALSPAQTAVRDPAAGATAPSEGRQQRIAARPTAAYGSILNLNDVPLRRPEASRSEDDGHERVKRSTRVRKTRRIPLLWRATIVLIVVLAAGIWYSYLAVKRNSVITADLPGASTVSAIETEGAQARSKLQDFGTEVLDFGHKSSAALSAASDDVHHLAAEMRDHYRRWRASH